MSRSQSYTSTSAYPLVGSIRESAHKIWRAGLGAYSRVEDEGNRVFDQLVSVGTSLEKKAREQVSKPVRAAERSWSEARTSAGDAWSHLEIAFERRVAKTLNALQIPTHRDVAELSRRVEDLQRAVDRSSRKSPSRRSVASAAGRRSGKTGGRETTPKRATQKSAAARKKTTVRKVSAKPVRTRKPAGRSSGR
jgi:poly(hydroxyalkanoate) granule-associated protein